MKIKICLLATLVLLAHCQPLSAPADPNRSFSLQIRFRVASELASISSGDSLDVCIRIPKGRLDDHYILEPAESCHRLLPGDRVSNLLTAFGFFGDPRKRKSSSAEIVSLPVEVRINYRNQEIWKDEITVDSYSGLTLPARGLIPLNDLGILGDLPQ